MSTAKQAGVAVATATLTVRSVARKIGSLLRQGKPRPTEPWLTAIDAIDHLDRHALEDIGAPCWLIKEVQRRQGLWQQKLHDIGRR